MLEVELVEFSRCACIAAERPIPEDALDTDGCAHTCPVLWWRASRVMNFPLRVIASFLSYLRIPFFYLALVESWRYSSAELFEKLILPDQDAIDLEISDI